MGKRQVAIRLKKDMRASEVVEDTQDTVKRDVLMIPCRQRQAPVLLGLDHVRVADTPFVGVFPEYGCVNWWLPAFRYADTWDGSGPAGGHDGAESRSWMSSQRFQASIMMRAYELDIQMMWVTKAGRGDVQVQVIKAYMSNYW